LNRALIPALVAALEAALIIAIGVGITLAPLTVVWLVEPDAGYSWFSNFLISSNLWLAAHGVEIAIPAGELAGIGFDAFNIAAMPLGITLITVLLGYRLGSRLSSSGSLVLGWAGGIASFGLISLLLSQAAISDFAQAVQWQAVLSPTLIFATTVILSSLIGKNFMIASSSEQIEAVERRLIRSSLGKLKKSLHWSVRVVIDPAVRAGSLITLFMLLAASITTAVLLAVNWIEIIRLYEALQITILGGLIITLGQLAILPNVVIYVASWLIGPGFAIGIGSNVSPLGTNLGPLPSLPIFGAIPSETFDRSIWVVLLIGLFSIISLVLVRKSTADIRWEYATGFGASLALAFGVSVVTSLQLGLLAILASGAFGPGRLQFVGIEPGILVLTVFIVVFISSFLAGLVVARPEDKRQR
jgi:hypothetical protein